MESRSGPILPDMRVPGRTIKQTDLAVWSTLMETYTRVCGSMIRLMARARINMLTELHMLATGLKTNSMESALKRGRTELATTEITKMVRKMGMVLSLLPMEAFIPALFT